MTNQKQFICTLCAYVHNGDEAPDCCPVCGATPDLFDEIVDEPAPAVAVEAVKSWRCMNCEHIHEGENPPDICVVCGAPAEEFEPHEAEKTEQTSAGRGEKIIILGAGIAGVSAAEAVREQSAEADVTVLSNDGELPYYRLNLTRYLAGEVKAEELPLKTEAWFQEKNIDIKLNSEVSTIDPAGKTVTLRDGGSLNYTKLIIASGAHAFMPPFEGSNKKNIFLLRHKRDTDAILAQTVPGKKCICIGGGILGLEAAGALAKQGVAVTVIEGFGWLLPRQLNKTGGEILQAYAENLGLNFIKKARVKAFSGDETADEVMLEDGSAMKADFFLVTTGVRSNTYFARQAGLTVDNGIIVNDCLETSAPGVFAAGDVCQHRGVLYGTWGPAMFQGIFAGKNALGANMTFAGIPRSNMLKILGIDMFSIGNIMPKDGSCEPIEQKEGKTNYACFMLTDNNLTGTILLGDTSLSAQVKKAIEQKTDFSACHAAGNKAVKVIEILKAL